MEKFTELFESHRFNNKTLIDYIENLKGTEEETNILQLLCSWNDNRAKEILCEYYYDKHHKNGKLDPDEFKIFADNVYYLIGTYSKIYSDYWYLASEYYTSQGQPYLIYSKILRYHEKHRFSYYYLEHVTKDLTAEQLLDLTREIMKEKHNSYMVISTSGLQKMLTEISKGI